MAQPTALARHPDGRLFIAQLNGKIHYVTLDASQAVVGSATLISTIHNLSPYGRVMTGLAFSPYDGHLYVSHSDGRLNDFGIPTNSGVVGRLLAPTFTVYQDVVVGLPRSQKDHGPNGLSFSGGFLYLAQAGMTNAGTTFSTGNPATSWNFAETFDSAAILKIDPNTVNSYTVYATGLRNPWKPVFHTNGGMYTNDNGPNLNAGTKPIGGGNCSPSGVTPQSGDELNLITANQYYGHPDPARLQCDHNPAGAHVGPLLVYGTNTSANGLAEYTSTAIPGAQGYLFSAHYTTGQVQSLALQGFGPWGHGPMRSGFLNPLDVLADTAGNVFVAEFGGNKVSVLRPRQSMVNDFHGDRRSDLVMFHPPNNQWMIYSNGSTPALVDVYSGTSGVLPRPIDMDGDTKVDPVSWHPTTGVWTLPHSAWGYTTTVTHGGPGDIAISADIDGDARGDQVIFRPSVGTLVRALREHRCRHRLRVGPERRHSADHGLGWRRPLRPHLVAPVERHLVHPAVWVHLQPLQSGDSRRGAVGNIGRRPGSRRLRWRRQNGLGSVPAIEWHLVCRVRDRRIAHRPVGRCGRLAAATGLRWRRQGGPLPLAAVQRAVAHVPVGHCLHSGDLSR